MDHDLTIRLAKIEARCFALSCMQVYVGARINAVRDFIRSDFEDTGIHFCPTDSFDEVFKRTEQRALDAILGGFADDDAATAAEMKAWLAKVRSG